MTMPNRNRKSVLLNDAMPSLEPGEAAKQSRLRAVRPSQERRGGWSASGGRASFCKIEDCQ
ncbi:hypothetical protein CSC73_08595 [Pseudoxanthomonas sacheonensis]|nr:hypothetical protein CSC73_08595 [Pseudoxanthomonas sacheonensis]